ncbi:hypothetical protein PybrP1_008766 [[Pythium] brassicae (nom. inval.)]|nr:hypothetical protein PybrP1_008766 [[Pythium] brassicae (nom. inval.)]
MDVGTEVWVKSATPAVWLPGVVVECQAAGAIKVQLEGGSGGGVVTSVVSAGDASAAGVDSAELHIRNKERDVDALASLTGLEHLHEPALLHALSERFARDRIYTSIGDILVAVNPLKPLALYAPSAIERYKRAMYAAGGVGGNAGAAAGRETLPPHVFAIGARADSGAASDDAAASNASTGSSSGVLAALGLERGAKYELLNAYGGAGPTATAARRGAQQQQQQLAQRFAATVQAFEDTGVARDERDLLFRVLGALLHLGNVNFTLVGRNSASTSTSGGGGGATDSSNNNNDDDARVEAATVTAATRHHFDKCAELLGVSAAGLESLLLTRVITAGSEVMVLQQSAAQAKDVSRSLAKAIYGRVFSWLVRRLSDGINYCDSSDSSGSGGSDPDVYAYDDDSDAHAFYRYHGGDGADGALLKPPHQPQQQQQQSQPKSMLPQLVTTTVGRYLQPPLSPSPSEQVEKEPEPAAAAAGSSSSATARRPFFASKMDRVKRQFVVRHFAGSVAYRVEQFVEKNLDMLPADVSSVLHASSNAIVRAIGGADVAYCVALAAALVRAVQRHDGVSEPTARRGLFDDTAADDMADVCRRHGVQVGRSLVFCKTEAFNQFSRLRLALRTQSATVLQRHFRGYRRRRRFQQLRDFVHRIQSIVRGFLVRQQVRALRRERRERAVSTIQRRWRRALTHNRRVDERVRLFRVRAAFTRFRLALARLKAHGSEGDADAEAVAGGGASSGDARLETTQMNDAAAEKPSRAKRTSASDSDSDSDSDRVEATTSKKDDAKKKTQQQEQQKTKKKALASSTTTSRGDKRRAQRVEASESSSSSSSSPSSEDAPRKKKSKAPSSRSETKKKAKAKAKAKKKKKSRSKYVEESESESSSLSSSPSSSDAAPRKKKSASRKGKGKRRARDVSESSESSASSSSSDAGRRKKKKLVVRGGRHRTQRMDVSESDAESSSTDAGARRKSQKKPSSRHESSSKLKASKKNKNHQPPDDARNAQLENEILRLQQMLVEKQSTRDASRVSSRRAAYASRQPSSRFGALDDAPRATALDFQTRAGGRRSLSLDVAELSAGDDEDGDEVSLLPLRRAQSVYHARDHVATLSHRIEELDAKCKFLEQLVARKSYDDASVAYSERSAGSSSSVAAWDAHPHPHRRYPSVIDTASGPGDVGTGAEMDGMIRSIQQQMDALRQSVVAATKEEAMVAQARRDGHPTSFSSSRRTRSSSAASSGSLSGLLGDPMQFVYSGGLLSPAESHRKQPSQASSAGSGYSAGSLGSLPLRAASLSSLGGGGGASRPAPRIVKWARSNQCFECEEPFNIFVRRHHCRMCGRSFCHEHSSRRVTLLGIGFDDEPVRVCDACFADQCEFAQDAAYASPYSAFAGYGGAAMAALASSHSSAA